MHRADLARVLEGTGCDARTEHGGYHAARCPSRESKVKLLDRLATYDARMDPRVRERALEVLRGAQRTTHGYLLKPTIARALHRYVRDSVTYVEDGIEQFQPTMTTLRLGGDCDDSARALAALARSVGLPARVIAPEEYPHAVAQLNDGTGWAWAETTLRAEYGEGPRAALRRLKREGKAPPWRGDLAAAQFRSIDLASKGGHKLVSPECEAFPRLAPGRDVEARATILGAWTTIDGAPAKSPEWLQFAQALARHEGTYGEGWAKAHPEMVGSNNWGAVQAGCPSGGCVKVGPNRPNLADFSGAVCKSGRLSWDRYPDGTHYLVCFKEYATPGDGAADVLRELFKRPAVVAAVPSGDATRLASALYDSHYFGGFGTREKAIADYARALECHASRIAEALGEPHVIARGGARPEARAVRAGAVALGLAALAGGAWWFHKRRV